MERGLDLDTSDGSGPFEILSAPKYTRPALALASGSLHGVRGT